jgi:hypothetical protein
MTSPAAHWRTRIRRGLFALIVGAIAAAALTASFIATDRDESAGRTTASSFGARNSPGMVGEFHFQLWKRRLAPAGSISKEIDFRIRRDIIETSRPIVPPAQLEARISPPLLFDLPAAEEVRRVLSDGRTDE